MARALLAVEEPAAERAYVWGGLAAVLDEPGLAARAATMGLPEFTERDQFVLDLFNLLRSELLDRAECMRLACDEAGVAPDERLEVARRVAIVERVMAAHWAKMAAAEAGHAEALRGMR